MQAIFVEIANNWVSPPSFAENPPFSRIPPISSTGCRTITGNNRECYEGGLCGTCTLRKIEEDKIINANKLVNNRSVGGKSKKSDDPTDEIAQLKKEKRVKNIALEKAKREERKALINSML
jgi:hypothetical protein